MIRMVWLLIGTLSNVNFGLAEEVLDSQHCDFEINELVRHVLEMVDRASDLLHQHDDFHSLG